VRIGGFVPFSLCEFPGSIAAVVFSQGCNFRCPFCHNGQLIPIDSPAAMLIPESYVLRTLATRLGQLDGVVLSGGEPTLQADLGDFLNSIKAQGFRTMVETNGSSPDVLRELVKHGLLDFIAMDIKAPPSIYYKLSGVAIDLEKIEESIWIIARSGLPHEFRTTVVEPLLSPVDMAAIQTLIPTGSPHRVQAFHRDNALCPSLRR